MLTLRSSRFLRAAENATAISAAAPTSATTMKPTNAWLIPNVSAAFCTDSTKISLTNATSTVTTANVASASPSGHGGSVASAGSARAKGSQCVPSENTKPNPYPTISSRNEECDTGKQQQGRVQPAAGPVVLLHMVPETTEKKGRAQHEKRIGHN